MVQMTNKVNKNSSNRVRIESLLTSTLNPQALSIALPLLLCTFKFINYIRRYHGSQVQQRIILIYMLVNTIRRNSLSLS